MKKLFFVLLILVVYSMAHTSFAQALGGATFGQSVFGISFGGRVTAIQPCNTGLLAYLMTSKGPLPVMWFWGNLPFSSYIPPHPGQQLLGKMGPSLVPCVSGIIPSGAGFPILFHGSSL